VDGERGHDGRRDGGGRAEARLRLVYLYPSLMNIYGDLGNVRCLSQRCRWRGIALDVEEVGVGQGCDFGGADLLFMGGAQDRQQKLVADDLLQRKGPGLRAAVEDGLAGLIVCGGYQLFGRYYRPAEGPDVLGLGLFAMVTRHPGPGAARCIGNVVIRWTGGREEKGGEPRTLVGFENHGGRTYLDAGAQPLGTVLRGGGNNHEDGAEGAVAGNLYGTYLHGSLLPKNPHLADHLIALALRRRYGGVPEALLHAVVAGKAPASASPEPWAQGHAGGTNGELPPLDDALERRAHDLMVRRLGVARR
jgi:CobQ-like glutamine amidotransferase family enzyme